MLWLVVAMLSIYRLNLSSQRSGTTRNLIMLLSLFAISRVSACGIRNLSKANIHHTTQLESGESVRRFESIDKGIKISDEDALNTFCYKIYFQRELVCVCVCGRTRE